MADDELPKIVVCAAQESRGQNQDQAEKGTFYQEMVDQATGKGPQGVEDCAINDDLLWGAEAFTMFFKRA